jgi:N-formylglutamate deformylase
MKQLPLIFSIPHCGIEVPPELRSNMALTDHEIAESVDFGTFEIFAGMPVQAATFTRWNRLVVDLNRNPLQRDAKGVVALTDYHGRRVFKPGCEPTVEQVEQRVRGYHQPYNKQLQQTMTGNNFMALFDCHSLNGVGPADAPDAGQKRKDITLSNNGDLEGRPRDGKGPLTCPPDFLRAVRGLFQREGFSVALNDPYQGGFIINQYAPRLLEAGRYAVQIEMNQDLYMEAGQVEPDLARIAEVTERLTRAFFRITECVPA